VQVTNEVQASTGNDAGIVRVGLLGCGNVGGALVEILDREGDTIARHLGVQLVITRVAVRSISNARVEAVGAGRLTRDAHSVAVDPDVDVVVELIGGIEPARELIAAALRAGKPVVTGNKELLAIYGGELFALAEESGQALLFEAAVAGAIPLIRALAVSLAGEPIVRVMGIVNGTTNFILSQMSEERITYTEALGEAQRLGFAERDPSADVEGFDASAKAAILASLAFNADVVAGDVYREGIDKIELADIDFARRLGYQVKLLAVAERVSDPAACETEIAVRVHPAMLPAEHPLAGVRGPFNAVFIEGAHAGELMLYGRGAGGVPTASAVLGDLIEVASGLTSGAAPRPIHRDAVTIRPIDELLTQYYVTLDVADRPGVLAAVATAFGAHSVSIRSMEQVGLGDEARLVFITHVAKEADLQATLAELGRLDAVRRIGGLLRVIGVER
jgi:homoserine dehydrogenase